MRKSSILALTLWFFSPWGVLLAEGAERGHTWKVDWEKAMEGARKEGQVTVYGGEEITHHEIIGVFRQRYPHLKVVTVTGHAELIFRIVAERRAAKYLGDVISYGPNALRAAYLAKFLDPIPPALILPEVADESSWHGGKHHYKDPEQKYIFLYEGTPSSGAALGLAFNTRKLKNPKELRSFWDILQPKWKGKIGFFSYGGGTSIPSPMLQLYYDPGLGPEYLRRLFEEMDIIVSANRRQATDWLAQGKYTLCVMCRDIAQAEKQGLPVATFGAEHFKEQRPMLGGGNSSVLGLLKDAPHPNAAKVFINWFLSREGQTVWQKVMNTKVLEGSDSMRIDIPKDDVLPDDRRIEGRKYDTEGFLDPGPLQKFYWQLLAKVGAR